MPFFHSRPAAESVPPSCTSSQGSSAQTCSAPFDPPPAYDLHISNRPPGVLSSLLPQFFRSRLNRGPSQLSIPPHGPCTQASPASDPKQSITPQARPYCVQVCPHEFLSFERVQRIMSLPGFKGSYKHLDALTAGPYHDDLPTSHSRLCKPRPTECDRLQTCSRYYASELQGLVLTTKWFLSDGMHRSHCSSRSALKDFLGDLDIQLCPHKNFDDPWIVEVLYRMVHPNEKLADPLDQWEADKKFAVDAGGSCEVRCQHCSTNYKMFGNATYARLDVIRDLGKGESPLDPVWLAQCGVKMEE